jgi:hypothetical protein
MPIGGPPNGSRLSCGAPADGRSEIHKRASCTLGHKRNSAKTGRRQLQALVRLTRPGSHRHRLTLPRAAEGADKCWLLLNLLRPGQHTPCRKVARRSPRLGWRRPVAPRGSLRPALNIIDPEHPQKNRICFGWWWFSLTHSRLHRLSPPACDSACIITPRLGEPQGS